MTTTDTIENISLWFDNKLVGTPNCAHLKQVLELCPEDKILSFKYIKTDLSFNKSIGVITIKNDKFEGWYDSWSTTLYTKLEGFDISNFTNLPLGAMEYEFLEEESQEFGLKRHDLIKSEGGEFFLISRGTQCQIDGWNF